MKNLLMIFILLITTNATITFASSLRNDDWGVVIKVKPISHTSTYNKPRYKKVCHYNNNSSQRTANMIIGGLIGSVVGNQISNKDGAGTIGAVFGSLIGADQTNYPTTSNCYEEKFYTTETYNTISHYKIKVRTRNGYRVINSPHSYNIHDIIPLN
ncbi:hypothetical protein OBA40_08165 [Alphaproteobacteria bacterium]|nr:hypothetical protein [Alphaproteobacteria bacterium]